MIGGDFPSVPPQLMLSYIPRSRQWTPRIEERFLKVLAATCNARAAYTAVGLSAESAYAHRKRWPDFARRWDEAVEAGYERVDSGLAANAIHLFRPGTFEPALKMAPLSVDDAIRSCGCTTGAGAKPDAIRASPGITRAGGTAAHAALLQPSPIGARGEILP